MDYSFWQILNTSSGANGITFAFPDMLFLTLKVTVAINLL